MQSTPAYVRTDETPNKAEYAARAVTVLIQSTDPITYGDLAAAIGWDKPLHTRQFGHVLAIVYLVAPELAARVVRKDTGQPGQGYGWVTEGITDVSPDYARREPILTAVPE